jgi:hypothetical protein
VSERPWVRFPAQAVRERLGQALESTLPLATQQKRVPGAQIPNGIDSCLLLLALTSWGERKIHRTL